jgi:hypothetical protein
VRLSVGTRRQVRVSKELKYEDIEEVQILGKEANGCRKGVKRR